MVSEMIVGCGLGRVHVWDRESVFRGSPDYPSHLQSSTPCPTQLSTLAVVAESVDDYVPILHQAMAGVDSRSLCLFFSHYPLQPQSLLSVLHFRTVSQSIEIDGDLVEGILKVGVSWPQCRQWVQAVVTWLARHG
jgi:hypothetical protein